jgi:hypothetical protein
MRRFTFPLAIAFLTFAIGVAAASLWLLSRRPNPTLKSAAENRPAPIMPEKKRTYEWWTQASGASGKYRACFGSFSSSDGMKFSSTNIYFDSSKRAYRELQVRLRKALEIVRREPVLDKSGNKVGEQVVATFVPYSDSPVASAALILVEGTDFVSIESASLQNILEYEKDHQR